MQTVVNCHPKPGDTLTCAETGKAFIVEQQGCTFNYASNGKGTFWSLEGVDIVERRELLDRTKPYVGYVSEDGKSITGWPGNVLARITRMHGYRGGFRNATGRRSMLYAVHCIDVHGGHWHGRGAGHGMCIRLRACKG